MKQIETLTDDIYRLFTEEHTFYEGNVERFGNRLSQIIHERIGRKRGTPSLRMSNLGTRCLRKLWYEINKPEAGEELTGDTRLKFLYGDILEELLLFLAAEAGHKVEGEQDELTINGVVGHRDAIIDGVLVDVKSASSYSYKKFADGTLAQDDAFGYLDQINAYLHASQGDEKVSNKREAAFLAVDKTLGKITVMKTPANGKNYDKMVTEIRHVLSQAEPPARYYSDEPMGQSGNRKLGVACSYCAFKNECWPGLQTYAYSSGPVFLTKVAKPPRVDKVEKF